MAEKTKHSKAAGESPAPPLPSGVSGGNVAVDATMARAEGNLKLPSTGQILARRGEKGPVSDARFEIRTPNAHFTGTRCLRRGFNGVIFREGVAYTDDEQGAIDCKRYGYVVIDRFAEKLAGKMTEPGKATGGTPQASGEDAASTGKNPDLKSQISDSEKDAKPAEPRTAPGGTPQTVTGGDQ